MLRNPPPPWDGEWVTLYHGTLSSFADAIIGEVDLSYAQAKKDFGRGFYTTTLEEQALDWAYSLGGRHSGAPAVVAWQVPLDDLARLDTLAFVSGDKLQADRFWSFVWHCRQNDTHHARSTNDGWYDLVIGPIAAYWKQRAAIDDSEQLSFHTPTAVALLNASRSWRVL
jgi:hypothetical protein